MRCYQINQVFLSVFAIFHVLLERSASNGVSRQCYSWLTELHVGWTDNLVHSVRSKRITSRRQQFHKQWQLNTITSLHHLCCYINQWFSTAGPQTGAGPSRFFAGAQNNLDFPPSNWKLLTFMLNSVKSWSITCGFRFNRLDTSVQSRLYSVIVLLLKYHEWSCTLFT